MNVGLLLQLALRFAGMSVVAVGGANALIPAIHGEVVTRMHWLDDRAFTQAVALANVAPGPNLLIVPLVGWHVAGLAGAIVTLVAFVIPPLVLTTLTGRLLLRHREHAVAIALRATLRPVGAGLILASGFAMVRSASLALAPPKWPLVAGGIAIAVITAAGALRTSLHPMVWLGLAALIGAIAPQA